jgi:trans-aconitate 2-methyltransferase
VADWDAGGYARFRDLRLRPALDLLARVPDLPGGDIVDLGCGAGAVVPALSARWTARAIIGVDTSAAMLDGARATGLYTRLAQVDIADWQPDTPPALVFSNAALNWLPDHARLMPRLAAMLPPGGVLAIQMPRQGDAPSHAALADTARALGLPLPAEWPVAEATAYARWLAPFGAVDAWETVHVQRLPADGGGAHPVRRFTETTAMRPFVQGLDDAGRAAFAAVYDAALARAYPAEADGSVLMPFRRVFAVLRRAGATVP